MQPIIYDVAISIDGYIAGRSGDISMFAHEGPVVEDYKARLADYSAAIMGKNTYEFAYQFGMQFGENPYPHMQTTVFSNSMKQMASSAVNIEARPLARALQDLKISAQGPIYLCGGGAFAASLLELGLIDNLVLKRAPILLGGGTKLFDEIRQLPKLQHLKTKKYACGYLLQEFQFKH